MERLGKASLECVICAPELNLVMYARMHGHLAKPTCCLTTATTIFDRLPPSRAYKPTTVCCSAAVDALMSDLQGLT